MNQEKDSEVSPYMVAFACLDWLTENRFKKLSFLFSSFEEAWKEITSEHLIKMNERKDRIDAFFERKKKIEPQVVFAELKKKGINLLYIEGEGYPDLLKEIKSAPIFMFTKGDVSILNATALAVVGTRNISSYGRQLTQSFVSKLAQKLVIISGLAMGVDALSHKICLEVGGKTIAVLGNGFDNMYPKYNEALSEEILSSGGLLVSEFSPSIIPEPFNFPRRNRIISGLSLGSLIIEGKKESGSLITAAYAIEQNREIFAVPGNIFSSLSKGPNYLIQRGEAKPVLKSEDIFEELQLDVSLSYAEAKEKITFDSDNERIVFESIDHEGVDISQISNVTGLNISKINSIITILEMKGIIQNLGMGVYSISIKVVKM